MKGLAETHVSNWTAQAGVARPAQITMRCGHCGAVAVFTVERAAFSDGSPTWSGSADCPSCRAPSHFFAVCRPWAGLPEQPHLEALYVHPDPADERPPVPGLAHAPVELQQAYLEALETFNSRAPVSAVLNQCRQTVEAIAIAASPAEVVRRNTSLAGLLHDLPKSVNLGAPILDIATALRAAGNIGSHYQPGRKLPPEMREQMMDLLDAMLDYLFVIPRRVEAAREAVEQARAPTEVPEMAPEPQREKSGSGR